MIPTRCLTLATLLLVAACTRTVVVTSPGLAPARREPPPASAPPLAETRGPSTAATLGIPPGHLPQPGQCRLWIPGTPPGRQPGARSRPCAGIRAVAPAGSWIVYRPSRDRRLVHVHVVDERRVGVILRVRIFEFDSGRFVRDEEPSDLPDETPRERGRDRRPPPPPARPESDQGGRPYDPPGERPAEPPRERPAETGGPVADLDIPPGQMPREGECRVWIPGTPPGRQPGPRSLSCDGIAAQAPAGSWIVYRPTSDRKLVHVREVDARRAGVVIRVRIFDVDTGKYLREENP